MENIPELKDEFESYMDPFVKEFIASETFDEMREEMGIFKEFLIYSFRTKPVKNVGLLTYVAARHLAKTKHNPAETKSQALNLAWCWELFAVSHNVKVDMAEGNTVRYGAKPWHCMEDVGLRAIMEAETLRSEIYFYLKKRLPDDVFHHILDVYEVARNRLSHAHSIGFDARREPFRYLEFEPHLTAWKSSMNTFVPIMSAAYLLGLLPNSKIHSELEHAAEALSVAVQHHADMDYFADPALRPRPSALRPLAGADHCTWLLSHAMRVGSLDQQRVLREFYGRNDDASKAKVREVFLNLKSGFEAELSAETRKLEREYETLSDPRVAGLLRACHAVIFSAPI